MADNLKYLSANKRISSSQCRYLNDIALLAVSFPDSSFDYINPGKPTRGRLSVQTDLQISA